MLRTVRYIGKNRTPPRIAHFGSPLKCAIRRYINRVVNGAVNICYIATHRTPPRIAHFRTPLKCAIGGCVDHVTVNDYI